MKIKFFWLLIFFSFVSVYAQDIKSNKIEYINGVEYYIHTVQKGQTYYGISKIYNTHVDTIINHNSHIPGSLQIGADVRIPTGKIETKIIEDSGTKIIETNNHITSIWHTVENGETLYSISLKYKTTVAKIKDFNQGISDIISPGQKIEIPIEKDTIIKDENDKNSGLNKTDIEDKNSSTKTEKTAETTDIKSITYRNKIKNEINIALFAPLYASENSKIDLSKIKLPSDISSIQSFRFIQFYLGFKQALKQFENRDTKINLYVYDVSDGISATKRILNKPEMKEMHLIVGPLFTKAFVEVQEWAENNEIFIVNPFSYQSEIVKNNKHSIKLTANNRDKYCQISKMIESSFEEANIIILQGRRSDSLDANIIHSELKNNCINCTYKKLVYNESGIKGIRDSYVKDKPNLVISLLQGEANITNYVRRLYEQKLDSIYLFCPMEWLSYDNIEIEYLEYLRTYFFTDYYVDYRREEVKNFVNQFVEDYKTEPSLENYAFQGYDIANHFVGSMVEHKNDWISNINYDSTPLSLRLGFKQALQGNGLENSKIHIVRLCNYQLIPHTEDCDVEKEIKTY